MQAVPLSHLLVMLLPVGLVAFFYWKWIGKPYEIGMATLRMIAQLLLVGYVLNFIFGNDSLLLGLGIVLLMMSVASWIALRSTRDKSLRNYSHILIAVAASGTFNLGLVIFCVLELEPLYQPRYLIPLAGMIYANAMNAVSLSAERFEKELEQSGSYIESRKIAFNASLIPQVNSFLAVGLVSLPGMMTGQILSGVSPLIAVRYQIMVMSMILGTAGLSVIVYLWQKRP